jgi:digeranylgeranylglycerophospholipid reductase
MTIDVLVVGGGPTGLVAARTAAATGRANVVLVERDRAVGAPVRCGEGVGSRGIAEFLDPDEGRAPWVAQRITRVVFWAPDGTEVKVAHGDVGYILDRTRFEPALAADAAAAGADLRLGTEIVALARDDNLWVATLRGPHGTAQLRARIVIAADGVEGMIGRWAGLDTRVPARDMESCAQYLLGNVEIDDQAIVLHFGDQVAPGGYAWVFPKGNRTANVGLGMVALHARRSSGAPTAPPACPGRTAVDYLDDYVSSIFPGSVKTARTVGGVIVHPTIARTVADGLMVAGDAAHMINPISGAGIVNGMKAGRLAGETALDALDANDTSATRLLPYHQRWMALLGDDHQRFYRVKEALSKFDDSFYNRLARTVNAIPEAKRTLGRIFGAALIQHPGLLPVIARYFV